MMDNDMERRVWERIYGGQTRLRGNRERLRQCLRREEANFRIYDGLRMEQTYGTAFARLADDALEHMKMLRRILEK